MQALYQVEQSGIQVLYRLLRQGLLNQLTRQVFSYVPPEGWLSLPHRSDVQYDVMGLSPVVTLGVIGQKNIPKETFAIPVNCGMIVIL
jgi:hypothetical protein